jgi:POT family proton-dependent oligopeptide transporter
MASYIPKTAPDPNETGWPTGVPYIIGNEGCERFSFYGMKSILQVHLTALFVIAGIGDELASETHAQEMVHLFIAGVYAFPMIGAIVADRLWGKYNTILALSIVYCAGHAVLAVGENSIMGMYIGLGLIAIGSGGIKPCVSAHVGDQFGKGNWPLVTKVFQAFYWIINFGSFFATLAIPYLNKNYGTGVAFGLPGILMALATIWFWMGRKKFVHIPVVERALWTPSAARSCSWALSVSRCSLPRSLDPSPSGPPWPAASAWDCGSLANVRRSRRTTASWP